MLRAVSALALILALAASAAAAIPAVQAQAVTPEPSDRLAPQQALYVRVGYESPQPLRFQSGGYYRGQRHEQLMLNASPLYPAGRGEALVWLSGDAGARIDEIRVRVFDGAWNQLHEISVPVRAEWHAGLSPAATASWAPALVAAQEHLPPPAPQPLSLLESVWSGLTVILAPLCFLSVPAYPLAQGFAALRLRGPARLLSLLPLTFMLPVYAYCLYALAQGSNLWPLAAIFASPLALALTLAVFLVARRRKTAAAP